MTKALSLSTRVSWIMLLLAASVLPLAALKAQDDAALQEPVMLYSAEELDNLLAPVALYPDPILAQVLVAATFPEQVELAARYVQVNGKYGIDEQPWDISVRAVAHYEPVLNLMADRIDWTTALGQAHVMQAGDVMASVQTLRTMARAQGNLVTTAEQEVVVRDRNIYIVPAQPRVVYVPTYDPLIVYHRPIVHVGVYRSGWSFGVAFPIGVWLTYDVDWRSRHVYYHGWRSHGHRHGWHHRSRPYVVVNNIYVNPRRTTVIINHRVVNRRVRYDRFDRYDKVHRRVTWERRREVERRRFAGRDRDRDRARDRGQRGPSWDRDNERRRSAVPRRDVARNEPARTPTRTAKPRNSPRAVPTTSQRRSVPRAVPTTSQRRSVPRAVPTTSQRRTPPASPRVYPSRGQRRASPAPSSGQRRETTSPRTSQRRASVPTQRRASTPSPRTRSQPPSRAQRSSSPRASRPAPSPRSREARPSRSSGGKASGSGSSGKSGTRTVKARPGKGRQPEA